MSFSMFLTAGILVQRFLHLPGWLLTFLAVAGLVFLWSSRSSHLTLAALWGLTVLGGMLRLGQVEARYREMDGRLAPFHGKEVTVDGRILAVSPTRRGLRYLVKGDVVRDADGPVMTAIKLHLFTPDTVRLGIGGTVRVDGRFRALKRPRNPGEFDFRSFYQRRNIWGDLYPSDPAQIQLIVPDGRRDLRSQIERFRYSLKRQFDQKVGGHPGGLLTALILGMRNELPNEIEDDFADSGVIHVLAVSGLHVGYVLIILSAIIKLVRIPYRWDKLLLVAALIGYAVLSGGKPGVWRATLMASLFVLAPLVQREANLWNILAASALILLIHNPSNLFDPGFLLSYSAVISIVFLYSRFQTILPARYRVDSLRNPLIKGAVALFIVSLSAQIGTIPFTWSFFNRIPIASVAANMVVVPVVGILVSTGFAVLTLGSVLPQAGWALGNAAWALSQLTFWFTREFSRLPVSFLEMGSPSTLNLAQYGLVSAALFLVAKRQTRKKGLIVGALALNLFIWCWALQKQTLDVIFLDVGQGDAAVIRVPSRFGPSRTILVDAGRKDFLFDAGERTVVPVMKHLGIDRVDLLIMSHPHNDHIGGVLAVLKEMEVGEIWDTYAHHRSRLYGTIRREVSGRFAMSYRYMQAGDWSDEFSPLHMFVIHPDSGWAVRQKNINNSSLVVKLSYGEVDFLLLGDLEAAGDREIVPLGRLIQSEVMKVGHHGSRTSTTEELLQAVQPEFAVVSAGERNRFNHP
ncbi:MAG: DNA internalization-related competence protein ComEC/Rec2, partial [Fidelibacterota bacterium]